VSVRCLVCHTVKRYVTDRRRPGGLGLTLDSAGEVHLDRMIPVKLCLQYSHSKAVPAIFTRIFHTFLVISAV